MKEAAKKKNVAENVKVAYSAMENIAKSNQKGWENPSKIKKSNEEKAREQVKYIFFCKSIFLIRTSLTIAI